MNTAHPADAVSDNEKASAPTHRRNGVANLDCVSTLAALKIGHELTIAECPPHSYHMVGLVTTNIDALPWALQSHTLDLQSRLQVNFH